MTTYNFRVPKDTVDIPDQAENAVEATTGTRHRLDRSNVHQVYEADGDALIVAVDFSPKNQAVRGGTIGTGRGSMRGVR